MPTLAHQTLGGDFSNSQHQVLIVGAGPVGLFLALKLHQQGVDTIIVERQKALYPLPRAVAFDHESRRNFGAVGLSKGLEEVLEEIVGPGGQDGTNFVWRDKDLKLIVDLHWEEGTRSGYPFAMGFSQPELEGLLEKAVLDRKIPLIRGYNLVSLSQSTSYTEATFKWVPSKNGCTGHPLPNEHEITLKSSFLVGCDGANSTVRKLADISSTDLNFENDWLIADLLIKDGYVPEKVKKVGCAQICDPARPTTCVFGGKGRKRFEFMRLPNETQEEILAEETLWRCLEPWGYKKDNCELERKVLYTFKARWANEFHKGRVLLAGDALHLMPPFIGQGLNSGFRDGAALAWRLPLMLANKGTIAPLLQSYQIEREYHIRKLTEHCILLGEVICETDPARAVQIHKALRDTPPGPVYDPPLGKPGILTSQPEAGHLSLHRRVFKDGEVQWYDDAFGSGWQMITFAPKAELSKSIDEVSRNFFTSTLDGKLVHLDATVDHEGEYRKWFEEEMTPESVVIVRPDLFIFGHAPAAKAGELVRELKEKIGM